MNPARTTPPLGVVEGFYGRAWSDRERIDFFEFAGRSGIDFYLYAPKADAFLRRRWREPYPTESRARLESLAEAARASGVEFGVGLSPYELYREWNTETRRSLRERLHLIRRLGADTLGLFFDDMKGDQSDLAELQAEIVDFAGGELTDIHIVLCPTYYSDDPVLDRMFGPRPKAYCETLGSKLDPRVEIVWTGPQICSRDYPQGHLESVRHAFGRPIWLWDNYPVNDGPRMCPFLHLRAIPRFSSENAPFISAHAINPMNQAVLSRIPILAVIEAQTLAQQGLILDPESAWRRAALAVCGADLAERIESDLSVFQEVGWRGLDLTQKKTMTLAYAEFPASPARDEILAWLRGETQVTDAETFLSQ